MEAAGENTTIKMIECPRDAMQGWPAMIPTRLKADYINALLEVGFDILDFGSFVSPAVIPQMADTEQVLSLLHMEKTKTKLLAIVVNEKGAEKAVRWENIAYLGYPFSISETFQLRNTNDTIADSLRVVEHVQDLCRDNGKELALYISMGFGNPYGDPYDRDIVKTWVKTFSDMGIKTISLADTVGVAQPETIAYLFSHLIPAFPGIEFGAHFHAAPDNWEPKVEAAFRNGCRRFDSAINGIGGCPMAEDKLVGNMATENIIQYCQKRNIILPIRSDAFMVAQQMAGQVFVT